MALAKRHRFLSHSLVALVAIVASYFFLFYGYPYLFPPSLPIGRDCSPRTATPLTVTRDGSRIIMTQTQCVGGWSHVGLYLQDGDEKIYQPFLILSAAKKPVIQAVWTSPGKASVDITGNFVDIDYARDRFGGVRIGYTLHEIPARD